MHSLPTAFTEFRPISIQGLGELTFLQLSTTYPIALAGHSVGYFASGTGGAGVGGAGLWWELRSLGVKRGISICGVRLLPRSEMA